MSLIIETEPVPLREDSDGVVRVGGTRVTLDTIVEAFREGATPEEIAQQYPSVALADLYAVIGYYLRKSSQVEDYLHQRRRHAEAVKRWNEARNAGWRALETAGITSEPPRNSTAGDH